MIVLWGVVGALLGLWLSNERYFFEMALGAALFVMIARHADLRRRLAAVEESLRTLRPVDEAPETTSSPEVSVSEPSSAVMSPLQPAQMSEVVAPEALASEPAPPTVSSSQEPAWHERGTRMLKRWFTEGNVPVKVGILVLFAAVAAALRFAAEAGYLSLPISVRLSLIAAAGLLALVFGWRERDRRMAFGLSLQGGAIGVLLLTVFAAFRWYGLLSSGMALALVVVLVAGAALLAVLQRSMALAVLGFLGGYLAPVLLSTGGGSHIALFSYYAVLNAAVFAISWRQNWRLLNLIGFVFTFVVGIAWGARAYRPELFWTVEPFLILFFLFYVVIGLLYVSRQSEHQRPFLDGTLVFGTPLVAFPLQAILLRDEPMALAFSAVAVAGVYAGLMLWLRQRRQERLLTEAYAALALGFVTLAFPLAFGAGTTASLWALEGAAVAWMGLRQGRTFPWLAGLALQLLAAVAYVVGEVDRSGHVGVLLLNSTWLGAAMLGFAGVALALVHDRYKPVRMLPAVAMLWGLAWWTWAGLSQIDEARHLFSGEHVEWLFAMGYLAVSLLLAGWLRRWLAWPRLGWGMALWGLLALPCVLWASDEFESVLALEALPGWAAYLLAWLAVLRLNPQGESRSVAATQGAGLWLVTLLVTLQIDTQWMASPGWRFLALVAPLWLLSFGLWRWPQVWAWPRADAFQRSYRVVWFMPAMALLALAWLVGLFKSGAADPLPYLPLVNPLELALVAIALLLWGYCRDHVPHLAAWRPLWAGAMFAWVSFAALRGVHHYQGDAWSLAILDSAVSQASLTVVWTVMGVAAWVVGSRQGRRALWLVGAGLMGVVLLKLIVVDRQYLGNVPGITSFLVVGLLLVAAGYFAPSPSAEKKEETP